MKQLFIVESPLQLLNAFEAMHFFKAEHNTILIRYSNETNNDQQINDTLYKLEITKLATVNTITVNNENRNFLDFLKILKQKLIFLFTLSSYQQVFLGNYDSPFMQFMVTSSTKIILLDDGFKTINTQNAFNSNHFFDWFTIFKIAALPNQSIFTNQFKHTNSLIKQKKTTGNQVVFIGSKLVEAGITEKNYYVELITKIAHRYQDYSFIYIPHRGENLDKLSQLKDVANFTIKPLNFPVELLPIYDDVSPTIIASFYSTALITLSQIYQTETIAFEFNFEYSPNKDDIQKVYDYCDKYITVVKEKDI